MFGQETIRETIVNSGQKWGSVSVLNKGYVVLEQFKFHVDEWQSILNDFFFSLCSPRTLIAVSDLLSDAAVIYTVFVIFCDLKFTCS